MKPSAEMMMQAAQTALRELVAPHVTDQWAASALRSIDVILSHLQARTPVEGPMLDEDNRDLAEIFAKTRAFAAAAALGARLDAFITETAALRQTYASVAMLDAHNLAGRALIDALLVLCHADKGDAAADELHAVLRGYLGRHLEREQPFFFPVYVGRPV